METIIRTPETSSEWKEYYALRYEVLRKPLGQPEGSERTEQDDSGIHFALFIHGQIKAIAKLDFIDSENAQVRFVAVSNKDAGKGLGKQIMLHIENYAREKNIKQLILHARENAVPFYKRINYSLVKKSHLLFGQVQHYLMEKRL